MNYTLLLLNKLNCHKSYEFHYFEPFKYMSNVYLRKVCKLINNYFIVSIMINVCNLLTLIIES